jgi:hypothetical protein
LDIVRKSEAMRKWKRRCLADPCLQWQCGPHLICCFCFYVILPTIYIASEIPSLSGQSWPYLSPFFLNQIKAPYGMPTPPLSCLPSSFVLSCFCAGVVVFGWFHEVSFLVSICTRSSLS